MNAHHPPAADSERPPLITKTDRGLPLLVVTGPRAIAVRANSPVDGRAFVEQTPLPIAPETLEPGADYAVSIEGGEIVVEQLTVAPLAHHVAGFHFAPGGNAPARAGGDDIPAINPYSLWDLNFRPACRDPRGMCLVDGPHGKFWCDIYLTGADHLVRGNSLFGAVIADGNDPPVKLRGGRMCAPAGELVTITCDH